MINRRALFFQAIRGPIVLITVGSLFAVQQTGHISFGRTWPILIIVIGLMKLLERSSGPVNPYLPPPPPPPGYAPPQQPYGYPPPGSYPAPPPPGAQNYPGGGPVR